VRWRTQPTEPRTRQQNAIIQEFDSDCFSMV